MYSKVYSAVLQGLFGCLVEIETQITNGLPYHVLVGLPNQVIRESKDRIKAAIRASGISFVEKKITQNLFPAHVRKEGAHLDLPLAIGVLCSTNQLDSDCSKVGFIGELSLDGSIRPVKGIVSLVEALVAGGIESIVVPESQLSELAEINFNEIHGYNQLIHLIGDLREGCLNGTKQKLSVSISEHQVPDLKVIGQTHAIRAAQIAALGGHHIVFVGPPGCGKTLIAEGMVTLLPPLEGGLYGEVQRIKSFFGDGLSKTIRPLCRPHHSITRASLIGGSKELYPGVITKAHGGVLLLDEINLFSNNVLDALREPLVDKKIRLSRRHEQITYPSDFQLVATMNPCKCGYHLSKHKKCHCTAYELKRYREKMSLPLLDRFDMVVYMDVEPQVGEGKVSQLKAVCNGKDDITLSSESLTVLDKYQQTGKISMRRRVKIEQLALSIARFEGIKIVERIHVLEAISYQDFMRLKL